MCCVVLCVLFRDGVWSGVVGYFHHGELSFAGSHRLLLPCHPPQRSAPISLHCCCAKTSMCVCVCAGVIWPLEGMPVFLRYISYCLPTTTPAESMRAIMGRGGCLLCVYELPSSLPPSLLPPSSLPPSPGWGLAHQDVWLGFVVTTIWFLLFLFVAGLALKLRK